jgi:hypothetical protein
MDERTNAEALMLIVPVCADYRVGFIEAVLPEVIGNSLPNLGDSRKKLRDMRMFFDLGY